MIKNVTLVANKVKNIPSEAAERVIGLLSGAGCAVRVNDSFDEALSEKFENVSFETGDALYEGSELIVVMGGDGSIIEAARESVEFGVPIVGINFGRLGYLAELEVGESDLLLDIIRGNYRIEERMMLDVVIIRDGVTIADTRPCLNDVVLSNGPISRMASFDLYCDGVKAASYSADGIIICTPTGSGAYSLSAGGPLIYQTMECICATPICPHSMTMRPIVFMGESQIELKNPSCRSNKLYITVDGRDNTEIEGTDTVVIKKSVRKTKLVRVKNKGFVSVLSRKLAAAHD